MFKWQAAGSFHLICLKREAIIPVNCFDLLNLSILIYYKRKLENFGRFSGLKIPFVLFADDMVLLALSNSNVQFILGWYATECEVAGMRMTTF